MAAKVRGVDRGARLGRRAIALVGDEVRAARVGAGLSQGAVGRAAGLSHTQIGRIERGQIPGVSVIHLARICGVVGLDLAVRTYPGGQPLRDAAHLALLERFRVALHDALRFDAEVPLAIEGDKRAWDAMVSGASDRTAIEAETRLGDVQALLRRIALKQRDDAMTRVILLLNDTTHNRAVARAVDPLVRDAFPVPSRQAMAAFAAGVHPPGSAVVLM